MSQHLSINYVRICIKAENKTDALAAMKAAKLNYGFYRANALKLKTLEDALHVCRWEATTNTDGDIVMLDFIGENYRDEDNLFKTLAPFVAPGSFILGDAECVPFRWRFDDGKCYNDEGEITYKPGKPL